MQIDSRIDPRWCEALLGMLEGDLNYNRIAEVKTMLRAGIDSLRKARSDTSGTSRIAEILHRLPDKIPDGSGGFVYTPVGFLNKQAEGSASRRTVIPGFCERSATGPGHDCEHDVGLPGKSIPGKHDGPNDTVDEYGRPNGWCEVCWLQYQLGYTCDELYVYAESCGGQDYAKNVLILVKEEAAVGLKHRRWRCTNDRAD